MKLNQLTIEELVELRTQMILEKKSTKQINQIIDKKEQEYSKYLLEDIEIIEDEKENSNDRIFSIDKKIMNFSNFKNNRLL